MMNMLRLIGNLRKTLARSLPYVCDETSCVRNVKSMSTRSRLTIQYGTGRVNKTSIPKPITTTIADLKRQFEELEKAEGTNTEAEGPHTEPEDRKIRRLPVWGTVIDTLHAEKPIAQWTIDEYKKIDKICSVSELYHLWPTSLMSHYRKAIHYFEADFATNISHQARMLLQYARSVHPGGADTPLLCYYMAILGNTEGENNQAEIIDIHESLQKQGQLPVRNYDCDTGVIEGLCSTTEWKKSVAILQELSKVTVLQSYIPLHVCSLIAAAWTNDHEELAWEIFDNYGGANWYGTIELKGIYSLLKVVDQKPNMLQALLTHLHTKQIVMHEKAANALSDAIIRHSPADENWIKEDTFVELDSNRCDKCNKELEMAEKVPEEDFAALLKSFERNVFSSERLYMRTLPKELRSFQSYMAEVGTVDVVVDALNISHVGSVNSNKSMHTQSSRVHNFLIHLTKDLGMKVLLVGKNHILKWPHMKAIQSMADCFFTSDSSYDDLYIVYGALLSGRDTWLITKDELRDSRSLVDAENRSSFSLWQSCRQVLPPYGTFTGKKFTFSLVFPANKNTRVQTNEDGNWHIPYVKENYVPLSYQTDQTTNHWMCVRRRV